MPTLRNRVRERPAWPAIFVRTSRPTVRASAMEVAQSGRPHRLEISANHSCPRRSNAFSWSAR
eukprot:11204657-Lingulodinium_polyedra.AAC.1